MVDGGGNLVIPTTRDAGRVVGGAILALVGGGIGAQIVRAISANRASTHAAWTAYIPAILVFGGIALEAPAHEVAASLASATGLPLWDRTSEDDQDENEDQDEDQAEDDNTIRLRAQ
jgi:hypothetical protein